jgi:hypothetical protein
MDKGRAIAQAVSRRLPNAVARVRAQERLAFMEDKLALEKVFLANFQSTKRSIFTIYHPRLAR